MALAPRHCDSRRLRKRHANVRAHLFTFLDHPEVAADNNSSERELRPGATYRKVTGGFRSDWRPDLPADFRSIVGIAAGRGIGAYQAIKMILQGKSMLAPG
jgi:transposase